MSRDNPDERGREVDIVPGLPTYPGRVPWRNDTTFPNRGGTGETSPNREDLGPKGQSDDRRPDVEASTYEQVSWIFNKYMGRKPTQDELIYYSTQDPNSATRQVLASVESQAWFVKNGWKPWDPASNDYELPPGTPGGGGSSPRNPDPEPDPEPNTGDYLSQLSGFEHTKIFNTAHMTPKYVFARIAMKYDVKDPASRAAMVKELVADPSGFFKGASLSGDTLKVDKSTTPLWGPTTEIDIIQGFSGGGASWQWLIDDGTGGEASPKTTTTTTTSSNTLSTLPAGTTISVYAGGLKVAYGNKGAAYFQNPGTTGWKQGTVKTIGGVKYGQLMDTGEFYKLDPATNSWVPADVPPGWETASVNDASSNPYLQALLGTGGTAQGGDNTTAQGASGTTGTQTRPDYFAQLATFGYKPWSSQGGYPYGGTQTPPKWGGSGGPIGPPVRNPNPGGEPGTSKDPNAQQGSAQAAAQGSYPYSTVASPTVRPTPQPMPIETVPAGQGTTGYPYAPSTPVASSAPTTWASLPLSALALARRKR